MLKPDQKLGIQVIASAWLAVFCLFGYRATFSVLLDPMQEDLGWTVGQVSLGYSLMMTIYALTAFGSGVIIDRWGPRPAYAIGAVFGALGFFLTSQVQTYPAYLASYAIFAGIGTGMLWVSSTVSVRKWFVGPNYARMWGWAFMGAPVSQVILSLGVENILSTVDWRAAMQVLSLVILGALILATLLSKKDPENYGIQPGGQPKAASATTWTIKQAFSSFAIWGAILAFFFSLVGEFLIWTQVIMFWVREIGLPLRTATGLYVLIGLSGIVLMPLMGIFADRIVARQDKEARGRKIMLIIAPLSGVLACLLLFSTRVSLIGGAISAILFTIYWAIEPGGVAGYAGSIFGRASLGKIWGLSTLICMGLGPALGTFMGGFLYDFSGTYLFSILFALFSFLLSAIFAILLPLSAKKS